MRRGRRQLAALAVGAGVALTLSCSARDNSQSRPELGQKPSGGPVGGPSVELAPACKAGDGLVACSQVVSVASQTVDVQGDPVAPPRVDFDGTRAIYEARLLYAGPAEEALDVLEAGLLLNGWDRRSRDAAAAASFTGSSAGPFPGHVIEVRVVGEGIDVLVDVRVTSPGDG